MRGDPSLLAAKRNRARKMTFILPVGVPAVVACSKNTDSRRRSSSPTTVHNSRCKKLHVDTVLELIAFGWVRMRRE